METTIPKGTKSSEMTDEQETMWLRLLKLRDITDDFSGYVEECLSYRYDPLLGESSDEGTSYNITADLEDIESFIKIIRKQTERFTSVVKW